jgi:dTMP kinase
MTDTDPIVALAGKLAGTFIVLDGPDGGGKSTQLARLADRLAATGLEVCRLRDPGGTAIGDRIREILLDRAHDHMGVECEMLLYMASRAQLVHEYVRPALARGACVLCDRFIAATVAYQGAGGVNAQTVLDVGRAAVGETWPDLTVILDIDSAVGLARVPSAPDRMEAKALAFHEEVRRLFLEQAAAQPDRFAVVDAGGEIDATAEAIVAALADWVDGKGL